MKARAYDKGQDSKYDPNSKEIYLTEQQVKDALKNIEDASDEIKAIKAHIKKVETLHRSKLTGEMSAIEASEKIRKLEKDFGDKFGKWAFQTKTYEEFYKQFGSSALSSEMLTKTSLEELREENDFLKDEIIFQEYLFSLELMTTLLDCIHKEGSVSSSIETMFGENWKDASATDTLEVSLEGILDSIKNMFVEKADPIISVAKTYTDKLNALTDDQIKNVKYPIQLSSKGTTAKIKTFIDLYDDLAFMSKFAKDANLEHVGLFYDEQEYNDLERRKGNAMKWYDKMIDLCSKWNDKVNEGLSENSPTISNVAEFKDEISKLNEIVTTYSRSANVKALKETVKTLKNSHEVGRMKVMNAILNMDRSYHLVEFNKVTRLIVFVQRAIARFVMMRSKELLAAIGK